MNAFGKHALYISRFALKNIKCFKQEYHFNLLNEGKQPVQWSVILGNNNTGKTTLLKLIASESPLYHDMEELLGAEAEFYTDSFDDDLLESTEPYFSIHIVESTSNSDKPFVEHSGSINHISDLEGQDDAYFDKPHRYFNFSSQKIDAYGTHRVMSKSTLSDYTNLNETTRSLFFDSEELTNAEEWLLQLDYARKSDVEGAEERLQKVIEILTSELLPDVQQVLFETSKNFKASVLFVTDYGRIPLKGLSHGYQTTIAWVTDLAKRLFDRYPDLDNPLHGPAIVLVDEIDLHLHPEWQRKIIKYLSDLFPNTQFIVTAHSPLIVQSAENVNLIMLEKDDETGSINVRQQFGSFQGWTVEEILRELMDMGEKTRSDRYLELMRQFEDGLLSEDYAAVKVAYDELDKILSPSSHQRKILQIQMSSLIPA